MAKRFGARMDMDKWSRKLGQTWTAKSLSTQSTSGQSIDYRHLKTKYKISDSFGVQNINSRFKIGSFHSKNFSFNFEPMN